MTDTGFNPYAVPGMPVLAAQQRAALEAAYADPPRAYHSFAHVGEVMREMATVLSGPGQISIRDSTGSPPCVARRTRS